MTRVTCIQCTDSKRNRPAPAYLLYDASRYFRKQRAWARTRGNPWYILSAKYGLVHPSTPLRPYNAVGISEEQAAAIGETLAADGVTVVDIQAGRKYTDELVPELEGRGIDVINHFAGCSIGTRESKLSIETKKLKHKSVTES